VILKKKKRRQVKKTFSGFPFRDELTVRGPVSNNLGKVTSRDTEAGISVSFWSKVILEYHSLNSPSADINQEVEPQHDGGNRFLGINNNVLAVLVLDDVRDLVGGLVHKGG